MDKKESLGAFGGNVERFEKEEAVREKATEAYKDNQDLLNDLIITWFDKNGRFAISKTARLYNGNDIAAFNIPVLEPKINCKATPGFLPKMKAKELNEAIREAGADLAIPIFADEDCVEDCVGFVICRGGDKFEILDSNPFGENEYSKDELYNEFEMARKKGNIINKFRKSSGELDLSDDIAVLHFLSDSNYAEEQLKLIELLKSKLGIS